MLSPASGLNLRIDARAPPRLRLSACLLASGTHCAITDRTVALCTDSPKNLPQPALAAAPRSSTTRRRQGGGSDRALPAKASERATKTTGQPRANWLTAAHNNKKPQHQHRQNASTKNRLSKILILGFLCNDRFLLWKNVPTRITYIAHR